MEDSKYKMQLAVERENLDPSFEHASRLIATEIERVESGAPPQPAPGSKDSGGAGGLIMAHLDRPVKMSIKVKIPAEEHPKFNFVGKLLGPQGNSLKRLQQETGTKMSILGKGSMRDKSKEEECRKEGGKYAHLNDELHVLVEVFTEVSDAYARLSHALVELKKFLSPNNDDIGEQQRQEMMYLNGGYEERAPPAGPPPRGRGRGRGGPPPPRGRGGPAGGLLATPGGRGGMGGHGGHGDRGHPPRGGHNAPRGAPPSRYPPPTGRGMSRGASRGAMRPPPPAPAPAPMPVESYEDYGSGYEDTYTDQSYGDAGYDQSYGSQSDTQYFDYGHGAQKDSYDDGYGDSQWSAAPAQMKAPAPRGRGQYRSHPYGGGRGSSY